MTGDRKQYPIATGALAFFPDAIAELAHVSLVATQQHHPGEPMHWDRAKSPDDADAAMRHLAKALVEPGSRDTDGLRHSAKAFWRLGAFVQRELEAEQQALLTANYAMDIKQRLWKVDGHPNEVADALNRVYDRR